MNPIKTKFKTVDQYISAFPAETRNKLEEIRRIIKKAAPEAVELISYNIPAFKWHGMLAYYAAWQGHIGFYPTASPIEAFKKELVAFESAKGTVKFPMEKKIPIGLVTRMVKFKVKENQEKSPKKKK
jgi:uncharacterized protein YdhG (YjbR/CyaY superfamily)